MADAVVIGAGSMIGAGVYVAWAPAARAAGEWLLVGLAIAGFIAFCNATSSAQLAAIYPESGGTYVYGRRQLSPFWGHVAGWGFVVGKTASCSAMALTLGTYLWPEQQRLAAALAVMAITAVNIEGLQRTVAVTKVLLVVIAIDTKAEAKPRRLAPASVLCAGEQLCGSSCEPQAVSYTHLTLPTN